MSKGKKQTTTQNSTQSGTSLTNTGASINRTDTPDVPDWVLKPFQDLTTQVSGLGQIDPKSLVPGANSLQTQAAAGAARLGSFPGSRTGVIGQQGFGGYGGSDFAGDALGGGHPGTLSAGAPGGGTPMASMGGSSDPWAAALQRLGGVGSSGNFADAASVARGVAGAGANGYDPTLGRAAGYQAATGTAVGYDPSLAQGRGYDAAKTTGQGYDATGYNSTDYGSTDYSADTYGGAKVGPAASVLENLSSYYNPFKDQITNPVLADFDAEAGKTRAQQDLDLARSGAFGGSGAALTKSATEGELSRARATTLSGLLDNMFKTSVGMSEADAGRRQQSSLAQAGYDQEAGLTGAAARTAAARDNAAGKTQAAKDNALLRTGAAKDNAASSDTARAFGATAANEAAAANQAAENVARAFGATTDNDFAGRNQDATNAALAELAKAQNTQTGQNVDVLNRAASENTAARNTQTLANQDASNVAGKFNATEANAALQRRLEAAKSLADITGAGNADQRSTAQAMADIAAAYGGDQRANIGTQATLGETLRQIQSEQAQAPIQLTDQIVSLLSKLGLDRFIGSRTVGDTNTISNTQASGTSSGSSTTKQSSSPMDTLAQIAQIAALFA